MTADRPWKGMKNWLKVKGTIVTLPCSLKGPIPSLKIETRPGTKENPWN